MRYSKNIAIFVDGTTNTPQGSSVSNMPQMYRAARNCQYGIRQCVRYFPGVGTNSPSRERRYYKDVIERAQIQQGWEIIPAKIQRLIGKLSGFGTALNIKSAYAFLCENYDRRSTKSGGGSGDNIYLFGFSRGAFAARSLAGFVDKVGVLLKEHLDLVEIAYLLYKNPREDIRLCLEEFLYSITGHRKPNGDNDLPVYFIGVFDTVSAIGNVKFNKGRRSGNVDFHSMKLPSNVTCARQALALHEFRNIFEPEIWDDFSDNSAKDVKQVWFPGAHSDVGGGYPRIERGISDCALDWMRCEAEEYGLKFNGSDLPSLKESTPNIRIHDSYKSIFKMQLPKLRDCLSSFENERSAEMLSSFAVHPLALERITGKCPPYYPKNVYTDAIIDKLNAADDATIRFQCFLFDRNIRSKITTPMPSGWWSVVTRTIVRELIEKVSGYLDRDSISIDSENIDIPKAMVVLSALNRENEILSKIWAVCACILNPENPLVGLSNNSTVCQLFSNYSNDVDGLAIQWLGNMEAKKYTKSSAKKCNYILDILRDIFRSSGDTKKSVKLEAIDLIVHSTL